ncbi:MAG: hypothetical protein ACJ748_13675 [Flavisolibacter sp.]
MKKLFLIATTLIIISKSFAHSVTANKNGFCASGPTWYNGSELVSGGSIIIPNSIIVSINANEKFQQVKNPEAVKIAAYNHSIVLQFRNEIKGNIHVRYIAFNEQIISRQSINQPIDQVILNPTSSLGNFIISASNGQDLQTAKQIIL